MSVEDTAPPPPPPADPPADPERPVTRAELEQLRDRVDDVEDVAYSTAAMVLEDDPDEGPEKTTVAPRPVDPPAGDPPAGEQPKKHSGLFA